MQPVPPTTDSARRWLSLWLGLCVSLIAIIVVVGGLTRLTQSGLSIVEWKPITGILPPMSDEEFQQEFESYQTSPQFRKTFPDMTLDEFRHIYWLEYIHRLLGRITGAVFMLPLLAFALAGVLRWPSVVKFTAIFALGGAQGLIGWYMVKSGLVDDPHVSPYRLAAHLASGFTLFALVLWQLLTVSHPRANEGGFELPPPPMPLKVFACVILLLIFCQVILGAFVAGLHAGLTYNTFPLMEDHWIPEELWLAPDAWYRSIFEDVATVQFTHRCMAWGLSVLIPLFWLTGRNNPHIAHLLPILFSIFVVQFLLGVLTLLFMVPVPLASLHQANALLLFAIAVTIVHRLFIPLKTIAYGIERQPLFT